MNISEIFIRRPIATTLLMAGVLLFGLVSYELLPVAALPNIAFPTIVVTAQLPGASLDTMAATIATPLEDQFTSIPGLAQMTSTSGLGSTSITLQFDLSRSIDGAAGDVQTAINAATGLLPKNLPNPPTYRKTNPAERPVLIYAVHSDAMPEYQLDTYVNMILAQSLSTAPGVGQVLVAGEQLPAVHVQVDPQALALRGISTISRRASFPSRTPASSSARSRPDRIHPLQLANRSIEEHSKVGEEEGLQSTKLFVSDLINDMIENEFDDSIEFAWIEEDEVDQEKQANILSTLVSGGILTANEAHERLGESPSANPAANELMIRTTTGDAPIDGAKPNQGE